MTCKYGGHETLLYNVLFRNTIVLPLVKCEHTAIEWKMGLAPSGVQINHYLVKKTKLNVSFRCFTVQIAEQTVPSILLITQ